jgi:hypothetical protein
VSTGYIRGGGGVDIDRGRVARILVGLFVLGLGALVVLLSLGAIDENARHDRLRRHGVPVDVTVTSCLGLASGTGITVAGYTCRGTFTLDGRDYKGVIRGSIELHQSGEVLPGVADPRDPTILATADSVASSHSSWRPFVTPGLLLVVLVVILVFAVWRFRRRAPVPA